MIGDDGKYTVEFQPSGEEDAALYLNEVRRWWGNEGGERMLYFFTSRPDAIRKFLATLGVTEVKDCLPGKSRGFCAEVLKPFGMELSQLRASSKSSWEEILGVTPRQVIEPQIPPPPAGGGEGEPTALEITRLEAAETPWHKLRVRGEENFQKLQEKGVYLPEPETLRDASPFRGK